MNGMTGCGRLLVAVRRADTQTTTDEVFADREEVYASVDGIDFAEFDVCNAAPLNLVRNVDGMEHVRAVYYETREVRRLGEKEEGLAELVDVFSVEDVERNGEMNVHRSKEGGYNVLVSIHGADGRGGGKLQGYVLPAVNMSQELANEFAGEPIVVAPSCHLAQSECKGNVA